MTSHDRLERRSGQDRRDHQMPIAKRLFFQGIRESVRRAEDRKRIVFMDRYKPSLLIGTMIILSLSLLDALFTLILIEQGASELNPVMRYYLSHGPQVFLLVKYGLTAFSVFIIVVAHENITHRYRLSAGIFPLFAALFGGVVIWELYLLSI
jgi:hypothetical protein